MGRIRRYRTALSRHHRSAGYGIHSPFAFNFVLNVLRERLPYYCYADLENLRKAVISATRHHLRHPRIISFKNAKLLFRVTNYFGPRRVLQIGTSYGVSSVAILGYSRKMRLALYEPNLDRYPVVGDVLKPYLGQIDFFSDLEMALGAYEREIGSDEEPFVVINDLPLAGDEQAIVRWLEPLMRSGAVVVMRNLSRSDRMKALWERLKASMTGGQTFTNEKMAVLVAGHKLPLQHFFLWF